MKKYFLLCSILLLFSSSPILAVGKIIATVGNEKITLEDFKERLEELPPQFQGYYSSEKGKAKFLDQLIQERLFYIQAKQLGLEKNETVAAAIERAQKNIIVAYYVNEKLKNIVVTDQELQTYYNANKHKYIAPARVCAKHVLVKTNEEALAVIEKINSGASIDQLAKEVSIAPDAKETADVGWFEKGQMVKDFEDAAFRMEVGQISPPVKTQYGYHVIQVTDKISEQQRSFESVKASIRDEVLRELQNKKLEAMVQKLRGGIAVAIDEAALKEF